MRHKFKIEQRKHLRPAALQPAQEKISDCKAELIARTLLLTFIFV